MTIERMEKAQRALDRAHTAMQARMPEQAILHIDQAQLIAPELESLWVMRAQIALQLNRPADALSALDSLDFYAPAKRHEPGVMITRAEALLRCDRDALARSLLETLIEQFPADVRPRRMLAGLYLKQREAFGAIEQLQHITRLVPSDSAAQRTLAQMLAVTSPDDCIDQLQRTPPEAWDDGLRLSLARLLRQTDRLREAEDQYSALLLACNDDADLWTEAGELADELGAADVATERLRHAIVVNRRKRKRPMASLAQVYMHVGAMAAAGRIWFHLMRQYPEETTAAAGLLVCAISSGHQRAATCAEHHLANHTSRPERQHLLARMWHHAAMGETINRVQGDAVTPEQPDASPLETILTDAAEVLALEAEARPQRADTHYHRAVIRHTLGETTSAQDSVRQSLSINPGYRAAQRLLELIEAAGDGPIAQAA